MDIASIFVLVVVDMLQGLALQPVEHVTELGLMVSVTCPLRVDFVPELSYPSMYFLGVRSVEFRGVRETGTRDS